MHSQSCRPPHHLAHYTPNFTCLASNFTKHNPLCPLFDLQTQNSVSRCRIDSHGEFCLGLSLQPLHHLTFAHGVLQHQNSRKFRNARKMERFSCPTAAPIRSPSCQNLTMDWARKTGTKVVGSLLGLDHLASKNGGHLPAPAGLFAVRPQRCPTTSSFGRDSRLLLPEGSAPSPEPHKRSRC